MHFMTEAVAPTPFSPVSTHLHTLPAVFINREGEPETFGVTPPCPAYAGDAVAFPDRGDSALLTALAELPENAALNRLRRALFETGQLIVTTEDGASRVCFAGVGDPERLFVELLPRDEPVPLLDFDAPGCLCLLPRAEEILRHIYAGETSEELARRLTGRAPDHRHDPEAA